MLNLVWLSDPDFMAEGDVLGHAPRVRLRAADSNVNDTIVMQNSV